MARRVDDDVFPLFGMKEATGRVDGDSLRLFVLEGVEKKGVLEGFGIQAAVFFDLFQFAFGQGSGIGQESADDGAFTVIDMADDDDVHRLAGEFGDSRLSFVRGTLGF